MRIVACSDPHGRLDVARALVAASRSADVAVCAGDLGDRGRGAPAMLAALAEAACPLVVVSGNHDRMDELAALAERWLAVQEVHGARVALGGAGFVGLGGAVALAEPSANSEWVHERDAAALLAPHRACDVLVSHTPPAGAADVHFDGACGGSVAVREALERLRPALCLCGHVHGSHGVRTRLGATLVHNLGPAVSCHEVSGS